MILLISLIWLWVGNISAIITRQVHGKDLEKDLILFMHCAGLFSFCLVIYATIAKKLERR